MLKIMRIFRLRYAMQNRKIQMAWPEKAAPSTSSNAESPAKSLMGNYVVYRWKAFSFIRCARWIVCVCISYSGRGNGMFRCMNAACCACRLQQQNRYRENKCWLHSTHSVSESQVESTDKYIYRLNFSTLFAFAPASSSAHSTFRFCPFSDCKRTPHTDV